MTNYMVGQFGIHPDDIILDEEARNTVKNGVNSLAIMEQLFGVDHDLQVEVIVVTSEYHLPRSLYLFEAVFAHFSKYRIKLISKPSPDNPASCASDGHFRKHKLNGSFFQVNDKTSNEEEGRLRNMVAAIYDLRAYEKQIMGVMQTYLARKFQIPPPPQEVFDRTMAAIDKLMLQAKAT